jgi:hypothetical protein
MVLGSITGVVRTGWSGTRTLATPRTISLLVFRSGDRLERLRKRKVPSLNVQLVCVDVGCISNSSTCFSSTEPARFADSSNCDVKRTVAYFGLENNSDVLSD